MKNRVRKTIDFWAAIPKRLKRRYGLAAHRVILIDAWHVYQNLYLACETMGTGTTAIGAYDQDLIDRLLGLDGNGEFVICASAIGNLT